MSVVTIHGLASGRKIRLEVNASDQQEILLNWLRKKGITIASSCDGEGVCKKCVIQNGWLTCLLTLEDFLQRQNDGIIEVAYL